VSRIVCNTGPLIALGLLGEIASLFNKLRQEGYWIHDIIVQTALREVGETS